MLISIFAAIWSQNLGDELILKNEIHLLEKKYSKENKKWVSIKPQFIVFSYNKAEPFFIAENIVYKSYFPMALRSRGQIFANIFRYISFLHHSSRSDLIIIGWGGILYDHEVQINKNPLDLWIFRTNVFRFFRKKIEFFAIGLNISEEKNYWKIKKIFKKSKAISVRDSYSQNLLTQIGYDSELVRDPVFLDNKKEEETGSYMIEKKSSFDFTYQDLKDLNLEWKRVWLALRSGYLVDAPDNMVARMEEWKINEIINALLAAGAEIILLPHSFHPTDLPANDYVFLKKFLRPSRNISIHKTMAGVYEQYTTWNIDLCIAMRLHSIILSQVYEIPFIALSYSMKTDEVLKRIEEK